MFRLTSALNICPEPCFFIKKRLFCCFFIFLHFFFFFLLLFSLFSGMKTTYNRKHSLERLDYYYQVINTTVLSKQNAASGLIPASVAITVNPKKKIYSLSFLKSIFIISFLLYNRLMVIIRMLGSGKRYYPHYFGDVIYLFVFFFEKSHHHK